MLKLLSLTILLTLAITQGGCKGGALAVQREKLSGKWYAKAGNSNYDSGGGLNSLFGGSGAVILELEKNGDFKIDLYGLPMGGKYELSNERITLNVDKILGTEDIGPLGALIGNVSETLKGRILFGGKTLYFEGRTGWEGYSDLRFSRDPPPEERVGPRTVNAAEASLVGEYDYDPSVKPKPSGVDSPLGGGDVMDSIYRDTTLSLREDNTFVMKFIFRMRGTWRLNGSTIALSSNGGVLGGQSMYAQVAQFGKQLLVQSSFGGSTGFALRKKS